MAFAVTGPINNIITGTKAFRARFANTRIEGLPELDAPTVRERLAQLDELKANGAISEEEHTQQRNRILGEL